MGSRTTFQLTHRPESSVRLRLVLTRDRPRKSLTISQTAYIHEISERFGITSDHSEIESPTSSQFLPLLDQFSQMRFHLIISSIYFSKW